MTVEFWYLTNKQVFDNLLEGYVEEHGIHPAIPDISSWLTKKGFPCTSVTTEFSLPSNFENKRTIHGLSMDDETFTAFILRWGKR